MGKIKIKKKTKKRNKRACVKRRPDRGKKLPVGVLRRCSSSHFAYHLWGFDRSRGELNGGLSIFTAICDGFLNFDVGFLMGFLFLPLFTVGLLNSHCKHIIYI